MSERKITIPVKSLYGGLVLIAPSWLSNGHWMVRKDALAEPYLWKSVATAEAVLRRRAEEVREFEDEKCEAIVDRFLSDRTWSPTPWIYCISPSLTPSMNGVKSQLYASHDGEWIAVDMAYAKVLDLLGRNVFAKSPESGVTNHRDQPTVVLMPMRFDGERPPTLPEVTE